MRTAEILRLLLSLSCSGTLLAGAVWLCRRLFGRWLSCTAKYYLWLLVLLRLVLPLGLPGSVMETAADRLNALATGYRAEQSLQGDEELYAPVPGTGQTAGGTAAEAPITAPTDGMPAGDAAQPTLPDTPDTAARPGHQTSPEQLLWLLFAVWAAGAGFFFARDALAYRRLRAAIKTESVPLDPEDLALFRQMYDQTEGLFPVRPVCSTAAQTPMLLGILRPVLVLPARSYCKQGEGCTLRLLLRHEMTHYRRGDLWYKWFLLAVRALHWFNPMMTPLMRAIEQDCERACDEAVVDGLPPALRRSYGGILLAYAGGNRLPAGAAATTLAGSEKELLRRRLDGILNPHRRSLRTAVLTAALALLLAGCGAVLGVTGTAGQADSQPQAPTIPTADGQDAPTGESEISSTPTPPIPDSDEVLVRVRDYIPNLYVELKYATADNLTGMPLYDFTEPMLRYGTVKKLVTAQRRLNEQGYSLKIWDAYRPMAAQQALWQAYPDPAYVSNPATGYLGHTRGNTVDVTLVTLEGNELPMPSGFDQFDARADRDYSDVSAEAAAHAEILQQAMEQAGFVGYAAEWSHYYDSVEYPILPEESREENEAVPTAQQAYAALLAGDQTLLAEEDSAQWWVPAFGTDGLDYEYAYLDLDGDSSNELLVQMAGSPEGYNGVFHYEGGQLRCWNSDYAEGNCRDYPLRNGTMLRQYDLGGSCSYILYRYRSDGTLREVGRLFARESLMEGEDPAPCPYYEADGIELTKAEFDAALARQITDRLPDEDFWNAL